MVSILHEEVFFKLTDQICLRKRLVDSRADFIPKKLVSVVDFVKYAQVVDKRADHDCRQAWLHEMIRCLQNQRLNEFHDLNV